MDVMEDEFYDGILGFLEERGITDEFIENLCHVGTGLKNISGFVIRDSRTGMTLMLNYLLTSCKLLTLKITNTAIFFSASKTSFNKLGNVSVVQK